MPEFTLDSILNLFVFSSNSVALQKYRTLVDILFLVQIRIGTTRCYPVYFSQKVKIKRFLITFLDYFRVRVCLRSIWYTYWKSLGKTWRWREGCLLRSRRIGYHCKGSWCLKSGKKFFFLRLNPIESDLFFNIAFHFREPKSKAPYL